MTKRNVFAGVLTVILLSLIVFVLKELQSGGYAAVAQTTPTSGRTTASVLHFDLPEMVSRADRIFRGTVLGFESGSVSVGGSELPTMTYRFHVNQSFKGEFPEKDGVPYAEITMLGSVKETDAQGGLKKLSVLPRLPALNVGHDYLLLMTPESEIGLSAPVGLGQGSFEIFQKDKEEWAKNEANNAGIFQGPVRYSELADLIKKGGRR